MQKETYRDVLLWGAPATNRTLDPALRTIVQQRFSLTQSDIETSYLPGHGPVRVEQKSSFSETTLHSLRALVGPENVEISDFSRAAHAYGKTYLDLIKLRLEIVENPPDAVIYPRHEQDIQQLIAWCCKEKVALVPFGGHSSVTRGVECPHGGISLDVSRHMKGIIALEPRNQTVTIQPGIDGPTLEKYLNHEGYTCGHFPQSFQFSTIGGWVATRGAGQESTYYGKIEDMVVSLRAVTPTGILETRAYPAAAIGPDLNQVIIGSEGILGVITAITLKIRRNLPADRFNFSFLTKDFPSAVSILRHTLQGQFGLPALFRLSDPTETDLGLQLKRFHGSIRDRIVKRLGFQPEKRCLLLVSTAGDRQHGALIKRKITKIARSYGALRTGAQPVLSWLSQRYASAYLRDPLMDLGVLVDTLETAVSWTQLVPLWQAVRSVILSRKQALALTHISHVYETGANLYFTFLAPMKKGIEIEDYLDYQRQIITAITTHGGALSHHHGIGRMLAPWMEQEIGELGLSVLKAIKNQLDPDLIMNPGGVLGLSE